MGGKKYLILLVTAGRFIHSVILKTRYNGVLSFHKKKKQKSPLTTGRIPPNLIQSENHSKSIDEEAHCVLWLVQTRFLEACLSKYQQEEVMFQTERITLSPLWK